MSTTTKIATKHLNHAGRTIGYQLTEGGPLLAYRDEGGRRRKITDRWLIARGFTIEVKGPEDPAPAPEPFGPNYWAERNRRAYSCEMDSCACCGRKVTKTADTPWAVVVDGGAAFGDPATADEDDAGFMGYFPMGSHCARKLEGKTRTAAELGWED